MQRKKGMGGRGLERSPLAAPKTWISQSGSAKSGAMKSQLAPSDTDLAKIVSQWSELPDDVKQDIMDIVNRHSPTADQGQSR
ncbi:MAG: hypothetical protein ABFE01_15630 [Phycisphaerales bacterium]|jgi:hypothetical protein